MLSSVSALSTESIELLKVRGQSDQQVSDFSALLAQSNEQLKQNVSAKEVLTTLSTEELNLIQTSAGLADQIWVSGLSDEGARNLLTQPDRSGMVDLNNDGIVEVGLSRTLQFPPVNAPSSVHQAWEEATTGMDESDKITLQLQMHMSVYGTQIDGLPQQEPLPSEQQWSTSGWQQLLSDVRAGLEFKVAHEGWTRYSLVQQEFYNRFERALEASA